MYLIDGNALYEKLLNRYDLRDECCTIAFLAPRVDAAPVVHGRWESIRLRNSVAKRCSECRSEVGKKSNYNYCPHCGADMRERRNNDATD